MATRRGDPDVALSRHLATLTHRGPDSSGVYERGNAAVGQTRLAIIDLVTGDPPITDEDGRIGVAFNGEIYNYRDLQARLTRAGHTLRTQCDTEVIAHLAEDHDPVELCRQLDGMFAFAVWDEGRGRLVAGRDRFGKKPLYYWSDGNDLVFGSEIKALLVDPRVPRRLRSDAIPSLLTFGYVPTPETFYDGIRSVPPGHVLVFEPGRSLRIDPYWEPRVPGASPGCETVELSFAETAEEVRRLLSAAVERRMIADVPLGAFLSGGVDSSAVVGLMSRHATGPVRTFTIGFEDTTGFDERPHARKVAETFKTDHTEFVVNPDKAELMERLVWHHDQPFGDSSALPTFLLSELTRRHVTVALCGDGGDELFAGYERFAAAQAVPYLGRIPAPATRALRSALARPAVSRSRLGSRAGRMVAEAHLGLPMALLEWVGYVPAPWRARAGVPASAAAVDYEKIWAESAGAHVLDRLLLLNLRTYLLDDLLPKVDRMSMAHGLEVRAPFLDRDLAEFAFRIPPAYKARGLSLKRVLKEAVADFVPQEVLRRPKKGFGVPLDRWFRTDLRPYVESMLRSPSASVAQHLDHAAVVEMVDEHMTGAADRGQSLWTLLTLELFLRREGW